MQAYLHDAKLVYLSVHPHKAALPLIAVVCNISTPKRAGPSLHVTKMSKAVRTCMRARAKTLVSFGLLLIFARKRS